MRWEDDDGQGQDQQQQGAGPASVQPYASMTAAGRAAGRILPSFGVPHLVGEASRTVGSAATRLARTAGLTRRRVWSRPGRHHIEVHGVCQDGGNRLARQVEGALEQMPGVAWARVNAPSGRVVVAVQTPEPTLRDLIATIDRVERTCDHEPDPEIPPPHPPEEGPRTPRTLGALASDALGLTISAATRILPFAPLPGEVAGLLAAVDLQPKLHAVHRQTAARRPPRRRPLSAGRGGRAGLDRRLDGDRPGRCPTDRAVG